MTEAKFNKCFNAFITIGMTVAMILATALKFQTAETGRFLLIVSAFGSLMGVLSTVCSANGKIWTFFFGLLDVSIYAVMCFIGAKYGNAALHALYFFPMQFIGFFQWRKRGAEGSAQVKARRFEPRQWYVAAGAFLALSFVVYVVLARIDKSAADSFIKIAVLSDAVATVCNLIGQFLLSVAYMEQWYFWIGVNIFSILMWVVTLSKGGDDASYALIYIIKYSFFLLNSINGLRIWIGLSRKEE